MCAPLFKQLLPFALEQVWQRPRWARHTGFRKFCNTGHRQQALLTQNAEKLADLSVWLGQFRH